MSNQHLLLQFLLVFVLSQPLLGQANSWTHYDMPDISGYTVTALTVDHRNHLWALTARVESQPRYGVDYFDGTKWNNAASIAGFGFSDTMEFRNIVTDKAGDVWVAGEGGVSRYDGTQWYHYRVEDSLSFWREYLDIACDSSGNIWVATDAPFPIDTLLPGVPHFKRYAEIFRFDGHAWETMLYADTLDSTNEFQQGRITGLCVDPAGSVWAISRQSLGFILGGLRRYKDGEWTRYDLKDGYEVPNAKRPTSIMADHQGKIWIGQGGGTIAPGTPPAPGGLSSFNNGIWSHYRDSIEAAISWKAVSALAVDRSGTRWFGTAKGVVRHDENGMKSYSPGTDLGLSSTANSINDIVVDHNGILWLATNKGVMRLNDRVVSVEPTAIPLMREVTVYPNPVKQGSSVQLGYSSDKVMEPDIRIVDILGQSYLVQPRGINRSGSVVNVMVGTEGYAPGLYYVRIRESGNSILSIPVIITP